ncbi:osmotically inducible protein C [Anaerobacillus alkalidiazotrophicus]|uniref:Osmotically inducible protein C n=1 Tax=Anaerobacillus alkalidiazotrophicus TaxID=472963 RepID=A0A1S2M9S7_9BACI|nr:OsmC family protein [Anaerobacillus alkalidiazotrophicus]OIJ21310.1 osmotically inducible protein C [Anaerobacillus alkalidiazotrophicus]
MKFLMKEHGFETEVEYGNLQVCGDEKYGFRPYQLLVSAIAVCSGGVLRKILEKKRVSFSDITVTTKVERNEKKADRIEKIHMHFVITGSDISEEVIEKCLMVTRKNCSMVQSVIDSIEITESFEIVPNEK